MRRRIFLSLIALLAVASFKPALAQVDISVSFGPPPLPVYEQPPCPEEGWMWVPGYWAWDPDNEDYFWVPGTWVPAPEPGYLWTPPWWGWDEDGDRYMFHRGYWAPEVGFYGGIDYGHGYFGHGYEGGRWDHDRFYYNRAVTNVNETNIHNVYETRVVNNYYDNHVSYNGGRGGIEARPTPQEERVAQMRHVPPPPEQVQRREVARSNPEMRASANQGRPPVAATQRPTEFSGRGVVPARAAGGEWHPPANRQPERGPTARPGYENGRPGENRAPVHASELPPHQAPPAEGNSAADRQRQQEQQRLAEQQNQEHQRLAQQQQREDQRAQQQRWNQQRQQQMEQRHQQQTQQMQQRHQEQQQRQQQRQQERPPKRPNERPPH